MVATYAIELPDTAVRGAIAVLPSIFIALGCITCVALGFILRWYQIPLAGIGVSVVCFIAIFFIPESPAYLVVRERETEAKEVLKSLRGPDVDVNEEILILQEKNMNVNKIPLLKALRQADILKSIAIVLFLFFLLNFCGLIVVEVYATRIFINLGSTIDENAVAVMLFSAGLLGSVLSCFFLDRIGRRNSMILSLGVGAVCLGVFGTYTFLQDPQVFSTAAGLDAYLNSSSVPVKIQNTEYDFISANRTTNTTVDGLGVR